MEPNLQLSIFMLLVHVSSAVLQRVTVLKGKTVTLTCPITNPHRTSVDWKNPEGYIMFFNRNQGEGEALKDKRYSIIKLSESEFTISISNVTFKDGGNYTCSQYDHQPRERKVEVTVLGHPMMTVAKHEGKFVVKCTAEGNHHHPRIFWKLDDGPEISFADFQTQHEGKKYISVGMLHLQSVEKRVAVKCLVRHPALHSRILMNFVKIGKDTKKYSHTTTTSSPMNQHKGSSEVPTTTPGWFRHGSTTRGPMKLSTVPVSQFDSSTEPKTVTAPTEFPLDSVTTTGPQHSSTDGSRTSVTSNSTRESNSTINNGTSTTGWISISETTEEIPSYNQTERNITGIFNDPKMQKTEGSSSLLVFLVTCLIVALLVVVIFFAIKLRRAHILWKRENEDSNPSEESSKSKSSQEERNSQGQRRRGITNTAFTQYVVEEPTVITSVINTAAMATESANKEQTSQPQTSGQTTGQTMAKCPIKETEL